GLSKISSVFQLLKKMKEVDADYYVQRTLTPFTFLFGIWGSLFKKKFVYMVASDGETDGNHNMYKKYIFRPLIFLAFKLPDLVICQNTYEVNMIKKHFNRGKKMEILRKGMEVKPFAFKENCKYDAIWIGRTTPRKRTDLFINLAKDNPQKRFIMLCIPALETDQFSKEVEEAGKELKNLEVQFYVPHEKVLEYVRDSKAHILTSEVEGDLSMTTLEASQLGVPTLSLFLDHELLFQKFNGGKYCEDNYEDLNKTLEKICTDSDLREKLGKGAAKMIEEYYNIDKNIKKFISILKRI
ncbi:MAG: glycosyltransferase, partial [Candidatus Pacebacteria bacterium]|nr:glycosyltransferase [Candidatus Paceibacterota bacterium]